MKDRQTKIKEQQETRKRMIEEGKIAWEEWRRLNDYLESIWPLRDHSYSVFYDEFGQPTNIIRGAGLRWPNVRVGKDESKTKKEKR